MRRVVRQLGALALGASLCSASVATSPPTPLLWSVSDADNTVYLLGTFHLLGESDYPLDPRVDAAFDDAEALYLEIAPAELSDPALALRFAAAGRREDGRTLQQSLDAATWKATEAAARRAGLPVAALQGMEAWLAALTLAMSGLGDTGLSPELGLDRHLAERAIAARKPTFGLETGEAQIALFDGLPLEAQEAQLREVVAGGASMPDESAALHAQWRRGDAEGLYAGLAREMKKQSPALYARLNTERNRAWQPRIAALLDRPGSDDALVAVGALHLLGPDGLVRQLAAAGYTVERR